MPGAEHVLDILLKAVAQDVRAYDQVISKNAELSRSTDLAGKANQVAQATFADLSASVATTAPKVEAHAKAAASAAKESEGLARQGREAAKAMGEMGSKGGELLERVTTLGSVMGSSGAMGIGLGALLAGLGAVLEGAKRVDESFRDQQHSAADLQQAAAATGRSYDELNEQFEGFLRTNTQYVSDENQARDVLASFVRAGFDAKESMAGLNDAVDLAAIKHEDLNTAGTQVLKMMEGQGRVAKELGIDIAALRNADDNAVTAHQNLEQATKGVEGAQQKLAAAERALKEEGDILHDKRTRSQHDLDVLQDKQEAVRKAQDELTKATAEQKKAQDGANNSQQLAQQVLDQLTVKTDNGRKAVDAHQQRLNILNHEWDQFSKDTGPGVEAVFQAMVDSASGWLWVLDQIVHKGEGAIGAMERFLHLGGGSGEPPGGYQTGSLAGPGRQTGGPVASGGVYTVGEAGPETLVMGSSGGMVIPSSSGGMDDTNELLGQVIALLARIDRNTKGSTFSTAAYGR